MLLLLEAGTLDKDKPRLGIAAAVVMSVCLQKMCYFVL